MVLQREGVYGDSTCLSLEQYIEEDEDYVVKALRIRVSMCVN